MSNDTQKPSMQSAMSLEDVRRLAAGLLAAATSPKAAEAALVLFEAWGKELFEESVRDAIAQALVRGAQGVCASNVSVLAQAAGALLEQGVSAAASQGAKQLLSEGGKAVSRRAIQGALRRVAGRLVGGALVGGLVDCGFGVYEGVRAFQRGEMTPGEATSHALREGGKGALAGGGAVAVVAAGAAVLGPAMAAPFAALALGTAASMGFKWALDRVF